MENIRGPAVSRCFNHLKGLPILYYIGRLPIAKQRLPDIENGWK
jgi:hypothetical protein